MISSLSNLSVPPRHHQPPLGGRGHRKATVPWLLVEVAEEDDEIDKVVIKEKDSLKIFWLKHGLLL